MSGCLALPVVGVLNAACWEFAGAIPGGFACVTCPKLSPGQNGLDTRRVVLSLLV